MNISMNEFYLQTFRSAGGGSCCRQYQYGSITLSLGPFFCGISHLFAHLKWKHSTAVTFKSLTKASDRGRTSSAMLGRSGNASPSWKSKSGRKNQGGRTLLLQVFFAPNHREANFTQSSEKLFTMRCRYTPRTSRRRVMQNTHKKYMKQCHLCHGGWIASRARLLGVPIFTWSRFRAPLGSPEHPWRWVLWSPYMNRSQIV